MKIIQLVLTFTLFATVSYANSYFNMELGQINGANVKYVDQNTVDITPGYGECNGKYWEITSTQTVDVSTGSLDNDHIIYICIDDSANSYPLLDSSSDFIVYDEDSTPTEPTWSDAKQGWYVEDDRCIGAVLWDDSESEIIPFNILNESIFTLEDTKFHVQTNGITDDTWRNTSIDVDNVTPANSFAILFLAENTRISGDYQVYFCVRSVANTQMMLCDSGYLNGTSENFLYTGYADRSIQYNGENDDADSMYISIKGWKFSR